MKSCPINLHIIDNLTNLYNNETINLGKLTGKRKKGERYIRYLEIKQMLKDKIEVLPPDTKLDGRPNLCRELDTTRTTLDKAMAELIYEGLLYSKKGSGTYVAGAKNGVEVSLKEKSENWGMIVPNVMDRIYYSLVRGVENAAEKESVNIILCNSDGNAHKQEQYIKRLIKSGVSGFIIVPVIAEGIKENYELYSQLLEAKLPFVFCNRSVEGISAPVVTSNDYYGAYIATKHLISKGYRHIAFIARQKYKTSVDRCQGYISALIEQGIEVERRLISIEEKEKEELYGYTTMRTFLLKYPEMDAVFCFNDRVAQGVYQAMAEAGRKVSADIGVIGYDDTELCLEMEPKLSSVSYKSIEIGEAAAKILRKMINKEPLSDFEFYLFQPNIVERDSCMGRQCGKSGVVRAE